VAIVAAAVVVAVEAGGGTSARSAVARTPAPVRATVRHAPPRPSAAAIQRNALERLIKLGYPIYCGGRQGNAVAFTFDDGPGVYTHYALAKLAAAHEQATFFVVGKSIDAWPGWVQREVKLAAIGDHTYTHPFLPGLSPAGISDQIERTKLKVEGLTGRPVYLFRPPYGAVDPAVDRVVKSLGLLRIMWTVDSRDSLGANWLGIIQNVEAGLHPGSIILMHENRGQTIRALTTLLPYLQQHHLRSVTLPELLASDPPSLAQLRAGSSGCGVGHLNVHNG
jgi:peptidoglycan/xylan/chitin deacetylase (PgdA/CDA1 family)